MSSSFGDHFRPVALLSTGLTVRVRVDTLLASSFPEILVVGGVEGAVLILLAVVLACKTTAEVAD
jgi:hypothetical protein